MRLARRLLMLCSAASLVLCLAVCVLWVRSYFREDHWTWTTDLDSSALSVGTRHTFYVSRGTWRYVALDAPAGFPDQLGLVLMHDYGSYGFTRLATGVQPFWLLAVLAGAPAFTVMAVRVRRRLAKRAPGLCPACRYDLRATPERCPECGTAAASSVSGPGKEDT